MERGLDLGGRLLARLDGGPGGPLPFGHRLGQLPQLLGRLAEGRLQPRLLPQEGKELAQPGDGPRQMGPFRALTQRVEGEARPGCQAIGEGLGIGRALLGQDDLHQALGLHQLLQPAGDLRELPRSLQNGGEGGPVPEDEGDPRDGRHLPGQLLFQARGHPRQIDGGLHQVGDPVVPGQLPHRLRQFLQAGGRPGALRKGHEEVGVPHHLRPPVEPDAGVGRGEKLFRFGQTLESRFRTPVEDGVVGPSVAQGLIDRPAEVYPGHAARRPTLLPW